MAGGFKPLHSVCSPEDISNFAAVAYGFDGCAASLLMRGFNDTYLISGIQGKYVLRLSGNRGGRSTLVEGEAEFLSFLRQRSAPIAAAVPTSSGSLHTVAHLPEGPRSVVVFEHVEGRIPDLDSLDDAKMQGVALAHVHSAAASFVGDPRQHRRLDLAHLLERSVETICSAHVTDFEFCRRLQSFSAVLMAAMDTQRLTWIRCHGDCHGLNAKIVTEDGSESAVLFDFDDGGFGYLAYDLAVHLWAQVTFGRRRHRVWRAFVEGYRSIRPIPLHDLEAIQWFVPVRHIWLMGEYAARLSVTGAESATWIGRQMTFLESWLEDRISSSLFNTDYQR